MQHAPRAKKVPHQIQLHGETWSDDYFWLREKTNPEVIAHLEAENAYTESALAVVRELRAKLYDELKARIKEDDKEVPAKNGRYLYYWRTLTGRQYPIYCRRPVAGAAAQEEILLDGNAMAEGQKYFKFGNVETSPDGNWLAYSTDLDGSEKFSIQFKSLTTDQILPESIKGAGTSLAWAADNQTVFYTLLDENERPDRVFRHRLGTSSADDTLVYKETDSQLFVYCSLSLSERYLFIDVQGKITSEVHFVDARKPEAPLRVIEPRRRGVLYSVSHHSDRFFIVTNDTVQNFRLVEAPVQAPQAANWREIRSGSPDVFIQDVEAFKDFLVLSERQDGLQQLRVIELPSMQDHLIEFPEPTYSLSPQPNLEFETNTYRFAYMSLITPLTTFDYRVPSRALETKKVQEIPSGYDKSLYRSERVFATAPDGARVPISIAYRVDGKGGIKKDGSHPLYLYGYGSYGLSINAAFSTARLSLLDRGFVFAIAHIRGGAEMGRQWYEDGKFLKKKNTFTDFIACAEHLINEGYTRQGEIAIVGGSAGGMLVGAVINERPELFKACCAHVPFVDVINTMLDESLPLTTIEFEEWGNPKDPIYYEYMKSYSPYDNVKAQAYPHLLVTSGLNDPRVTYWEPAKWVAKLREMKTDQNLLLQRINMEAGHSGPSGRFETLKQTALEYAFLLLVFGKTP